MQSLIKNYEEERNDNSISIENSKKPVNYDPIEINKNLDLIDDIKDKLIFSLYTLITPRRLEWSNVQILEADNCKDNIIILNKDKSKTVVIFNKYKTSPTYGKQILENLPIKLLDILYEYIDTYNKINGNYLFTKSSTNDKCMTESAFGIMLSSIFKSVYNFDITNRYLRMAYSTYIDKKNLSNNEIEKIASTRHVENNNQSRGTNCFSKTEIMWGDAHHIHRDTKCEFQPNFCGGPFTFEKINLFHIK